MKHPLADKTLYLLDMDGTIYLENDLIDGAADFIQWLRDTLSQNHHQQVIKLDIQMEVTADGFLLNIMDLL